MNVLHKKVGQHGERLQEPCDKSHPDDLEGWSRECLEAELFVNPLESQCIRLRRELHRRA